MGKILENPNSIKAIKNLRSEIKRDIIIKNTKENTILSDDIKREVNKIIVKKYRNNLIGFK